MTDALAWTLIHFLWQGAALGVAAFVALRVERAATRYLVGVVTLAAMLLVCVATFLALSRPAANVDAASGASIEVPQLQPTASEFLLTIDGKTVERHASSAPVRASLAALAPFRPAPLPPTARALVVTLWAIGVFALSLRLFGGWLLTRRLATAAVESVSPVVHAAANLIAERLALRRAVTIVESGAVMVPTLSASPATAAKRSTICLSKVSRLMRINHFTLGKHATRPTVRLPLPLAVTACRIPQGRLSKASTASRW